MKITLILAAMLSASAFAAEVQPVEEAKKRVSNPRRN